MLCDNCKKNIATTHIKTVINGVVYERNLCGDCYKKEKGIGNDMSVSDILASMFDGGFLGSTEENVQRCDVCKSSFEDIAKTGKAGCPKCYSVFYDNLIPYIKRIHGNTKHIGKIPGKTVNSESVSEYEKLKKQLEECIKEENFEQAAVLRDKLKEIKKEGN